MPKVTDKLSEENFLFKELTWEIRNFLKLPSRVNYYTSSPKFRFANATWWLDLYPNGQYSKESAGHIDIYLTREKSSVPDHGIRCQIGLKTCRGKEYESFPFEYTYDDNDQVYGVDRFFKRSKIVDKRQLLLPNGTLTVVCQIRVKERATMGESYHPQEQRNKPSQTELHDASCQTNVPQSITHRELPTESSQSEVSESLSQRELQEASSRTEDPEFLSQTELRDAPSHTNVPESISHKELQNTSSEIEVCESVTLTEPKEASSKTEVFESVTQRIVNEESTSVKKLQLDYNKLLKSEEDSDVCLKVSNKEFRAHKCILRARSTVFSAMFKHETEEKASGKVVIDDLDPDSFPGFLQHVYSGRVESLSSKNASSLYTAADKYDLQELKSECREYMKHTLSVDTFCGVVTLALRYQEDELLKLAVEFFSKNLKKIIVTVEWQTFARDHYTEANELLIKALV